MSVVSVVPEAKPDLSKAVKMLMLVGFKPDIAHELAERAGTAERIAKVVEHAYELRKAGKIKAKNRDLRPWVRTAIESGYEWETP